MVGKLSPHLALDSPCHAVRRQAEDALAEELSFASHLTLPAVTLQLHGGPNTNLARHLYSRVVNSCSYQVPTAGGQGERVDVSVDDQSKKEWCIRDSYFIGPL